MTDDEKKKRGAFAKAKEAWLKIVASYPNLSGADYAAAIMLSTYFNQHTRKAWPSLRTLAADTNRNKSTIIRSMRRLEALNLVAVVRGCGRKHSNTYRPKLGDLNLDPKTLKRSTSAHGWTNKRVRTRTERVASSRRKGRELAYRTSEEPQRNSRAVDSRGETTSDRKLQSFTAPARPIIVPLVAVATVQAVAVDEFTTIPELSIH